MALLMMAAPGCWYSFDTSSVTLDTPPTDAASDASGDATGGAASDMLTTGGMTGGAMTGGAMTGGAMTGGAMTGGAMTGGMTGGTTGGATGGMMGNACDGSEEIMITAEDATNDGGRRRDDANEPNRIIELNANGERAVFEVDVPCDGGTWTIWARATNTDDEDSFFVQIDGMPEPDTAIFEIECTGDGNGDYLWNDLNYRETSAGGCEYLFDPWTQMWDSGLHTVAFSHREGTMRISRIIATTNPNFMP